MTKKGNDQNKRIDESRQTRNPSLEESKSDNSIRPINTNNTVTNTTAAPRKPGSGGSNGGGNSSSGNY